MKIKLSILLAWDPKSSIFLGLWIWQGRLSIFFNTGQEKLTYSIQHCYSSGVWTWEGLQGSGNAHSVLTLLETLSNLFQRLPHLQCFPSNHTYFVLCVRKIFRWFCKLFFIFGLRRRFWGRDSLGLFAFCNSWQNCRSLRAIKFSIWRDFKGLH